MSSPSIKRRHARSVARKRARRRAHHKLWRRGKNRTQNGMKHDKPQIVAPESFTLNENPEGVVCFINTLERSFESKQPVYIILDKVSSIDAGAIVSLLAIMKKFKSAGIPFNGTMPSDINSCKILRESGFFKYLYSPISWQDEDEFVLKNGGKNEVITHAKTTVDPRLAQTVIESAAQTIWGAARRCPGVYRTLIELMHNTHNHASFDRKGEQHWWLYVSHDETAKVARFAFLDLGVGIFESLQRKPVGSPWQVGKEMLFDLFKYSNNAEFLALILNGELHRAVSVTGENHRGKGLPAIADCIPKQQLSALRIVSNDVFANPGEGDYRLMSKCFNGTYIYWELGEANESIC